MKKVRIEFHGGFKDGDVLVGDPGTNALVKIFFFLADRGRIGQRFRAEPQKDDTRAMDWLDEVLAIDDEDEMFRAIIEHATAEEAAQEEQTPQMYEVTQCEEGPEEIRIRVDAIDDPI